MKYLILALFFSMNANAYSVTLAWSPTDDPTVTTTRLFTQAGPGAQFTLAREISEPASFATLSGLQDGIQYAFYATYIDSYGLESDPSNVVYWLTNPYLNLAPGTGLTLSVTAGNRYAIDESTDLVTWKQVVDFIAEADLVAAPVRFDQPHLFFRVRRVIQ